MKNVSNLVNASLKSGVDLHAAVITTSVDTAPWQPVPGYVHGGRLIGVTNKVAKTIDGNFEQVLTENLKTGMRIDGSATEQPFDAVRFALSEPLLSTENAGFLRPNAGLAIFLLTDADDQSKDPVANRGIYCRLITVSDIDETRSHVLSTNTGGPKEYSLNGTTIRSSAPRVPMLFGCGSFSEKSA